MANFIKLDADKKEEEPTTCNTDGKFHRFVTVVANRSRHASVELSLGR